MMHIHILKTDKTEYTVVTKSPEWDWEEFILSPTMHTIDKLMGIIKITTRVMGEDGSISESTFI
jgi:hypothetical protein